MVVWMHEQPMLVGRTYLAKHTTRSVRATVRAIRYRVDVNTLGHIAAQSLAMNEIAEVEFETNLPLFFDSYRECRTTGSLILIDRLSNATVGAAMIAGVVEGSGVSGHAGLPSLILLPGRAELAAKVREALAARGEQAVVIDDALIPDSGVAAAVRALDLAGVIAISARALPQEMIDAIDGFVSGTVALEDGADESGILMRYSVTQ
jgi:bifunctional enzyme CysN/CysC/sulfate adenylyltransferase subunit 1